MRKQTAKINQITEGVIWKQLLIFFFPIAIGTFFQQLYNMVDTVVVGQFVGKEALASVGGSAAQVVSFIVGFFTGFTSGASVVVSQAFGAKNEVKVQKGLHTAYAVSICAGIVMSIIGIAITDKFLELMNTPQELMAVSSEYLKIYFMGVIFVFVYNMGSGILRASGDSKNPLYYLICCCIINIVLDLLFVIVFKMGVKGVAIATLIAQAVSAVLVTVRLLRTKGMLKLSIKNIAFDKRNLKTQLRIGLPTGFQSVLFGITNILIQAFLNNFGTDTMAAWSAYGKLDAIFWLINGAFGISISTFVGQNYGAGKYDRVHKSTKTCLLMDLSAALIMVVGITVFRDELLKIFTTDENVLAIGSDMIKFITPWYMTYVFIEILSGSLRGRGKVIVPTIITLFGVCVLRILWLFIGMRVSPTLEVLMLSYPVTWVVTAIAFAVYYIIERRNENPA